MYRRSSWLYIALIVMFHVSFSACSNGGSSSNDDNGLSAVTGLSSTSGDSKIGLTWDALDGAASYNLYWEDSTTSRSIFKVTDCSGDRFEGITDTSYTHSGLTNGNAYKYSVTAVDGNGAEGVCGDSVSVTPNVGGGGDSGGGDVAGCTDSTATNYNPSATTDDGSCTYVEPTLPPPLCIAFTGAPGPSGLYVAAGNARVKITWNSKPGAVSYTLHEEARGGLGGAGVRTIRDVSSPTGFAGLFNLMTYCYKVSATNGCGDTTNRSAEVCATPLYAPYAPVLTSVSKTGSKALTISWSPSDWADEYDLYYTVGFTGVWNRLESVTSPFYHAGLAGSIAHSYKVKAYGIGGESDFSNLKSAIPNP